MLKRKHLPFVKKSSLCLGKFDSMPISSNFWLLMTFGHYRNTGSYCSSDNLFPGELKKEDGGYRESDNQSYSPG